MLPCLMTVQFYGGHQKRADLFLDVQLVVALADGGAVEGVGLQDIGTRLQERRVNLLYHLHTSDHEIRFR